MLHHLAPCCCASMPHMMADRVQTRSYLKMVCLLHQMQPKKGEPDTQKVYGTITPPGWP